jgi:hypothetical protein
MRIYHSLRQSCAGLLSLCLLIPNASFAAHPSSVQPTTAHRAAAIHDVALHKGGVLLGEVVDAQGNGSAKVKVQLLQHGAPLRQGRTDESGQFLFDGLSGGVYQVVTPNCGAVVRAWAPQTAPPAARPAVLLIDHHLTVRSQGGFPLDLSRHMITGMVIAAAIAVPIAMATDDDDGS